MLRWVIKKLISLGHQEVALRAGKPRQKGPDVLTRPRVWERGKRLFNCSQKREPSVSTTWRDPCGNSFPLSLKMRTSHVQKYCESDMLILLIMESPAGDFTYIILFSLYDKPANGFINPIFQVTWFGLWELIAFVHRQSCSSVSLLNLVPRLSDSIAMPHTENARTLGSVGWL